MALAHGESDSWSIRTLLLLQASNCESVHIMREMLSESIQAKYGTRRLKPVPLSGSNSSYPAPEEVSDKKKKTDHQRALTSDENTNQGNESGTDFIEGMEIDGGCIVCNSTLAHVWNPIVECAECHTCYHAECHEPEIMGDMNDPRVVWYCRNCNKSLHNKPKLTNSVKTASSSGKHTSSTSRSRSPPGSSSSSGNKSFGSKRSLHNKLSVLSSSSGKHHNPKISVYSADRRLQIMKKRAARKQEKKSKK